MRMPALGEVFLAVCAVVFVAGAVGSILYRVARGDGQSARLQKLKEELEAETKKGG